MWTQVAGGVTPGRGVYASAACPNGVNYCDNATAWASCCGDIGGSYTITPQAGFQYLRNAGFTAVQAYSMLYLMNRESSFVPDVIAHCPPCCCTEAGVDAVGLLQIVIQAWPQYSIEYLKDPQNNCYAAAHVFQQQGWGAWTPLNAALDPGTIAYWQSVVGGGGTSDSEPGTSPASDIINSPRASSPPPITSSGSQPSVVPPQPTPAPEPPNLPALYNAGMTGFEAIQRWYGNDAAYYTGHDQYLIGVLTQIFGGNG